jgi:hypothetical protein
VSDEEKLGWGPGDFFISQCAHCKHKSEDGEACAAFPEGIPDEILLNQHDHRDPFPGDHGIRFEPDDVP